MTRIIFMLGSAALATVLLVLILALSASGPDGGSGPALVGGLFGVAALYVFAVALALAGRRRAG